MKYKFFDKKYNVIFQDNFTLEQINNKATFFKFIENCILNDANFPMFKTSDNIMYCLQISNNTIIIKKYF